MTKQVEKEKKFSKESNHIMNMGPILEEMELNVRNAIEGIYIQKTREVINGMRSAQGDKERKSRILNVMTLRH
jgi:capping protein beta